MTNKFINLIMVIGLCFIFTACGLNSNDVASLRATPTIGIDDQILDIEIKMMEFTECLRGEGFEVIDPVVDSDGNIGKPEIIDKAYISKEEWTEAYVVCGEIIENISFEKERIDLSEQLDQFISLAACLRDKNFDIYDPTAETLDLWLNDFKIEIDTDPDIQAAYEECAGGNVNSSKDFTDKKK